MDPPTDVRPGNATFSATYSNLSDAANYSYYFEYGPCAGFPTNGQTILVPVPPGEVDGANSTGSIPSVTVGGLSPSTEYCVRVCMEDETAGSGYICSSNPTSFTTPKAPEVVTGPPYYIGYNNGSTLQGSYNSFVPGHNLTAYYLYGECATFPTTAQATANQSIVSTTGNGTLAPVAVTGLSADTLYCTSACIIDLNADPYTPVPLCGGVQNFSWPSPVSE